ncbi:MAG: hypothetical protein KJN63_07715, partial [Acidimicrobiia bacterium]|nr:hypothetical protein [Acidimicrobiia bacterium]
QDGVVLEFENTTETPVGLTLSVRPYDLAGQPCSPTVRLSSDRIQVGKNDIWLQNDARDTVPELGATVVPLPHRATTRAFISPGQPNAERALPDSSTAIRAWDLLITDTTRLTLPDERMSSLYDQSRGRLGLSTFDLAERVSELGDSAGSELAALAQGGFRREAVEVLRTLLADRWHPRALRRSDDHGPAAELVDGLSWATTMYAPNWAEEFIAAATQLTSSVAKRGTDRHRLLAERGLARLVLTSGDHAGARQIDADFGFGGPGPITSLEDLVAHTQAASDTGSWGDDEVGPAAVAVRSLRSLVVSESWAVGQPQVALFPKGFPAAWRGGPAEVHSVPTAFGDVSAAIRWHGARPALLWEFERADHVMAPVSLRCRSLDPDWVTTDRRGEVLLAGSSLGLAEPPTEGQSFS